MSQGAAIFSVIIPCYNHGRFLPDAVTSLAAQDVPGLETIIVDDGSTDDTCGVASGLISEYPQLAATVIRQDNRGPAAARNTGIALAHGEWIVTLDSDDILAEGFLAEAARAVTEHPETNAFTGAYREFGARESDWKLTRFDPERLKSRGNILNCSPFRKALWQKVGGFDPSNPLGGEDWHFWLKCLQQGLRMLCLPIPMLYYRQHENAGRDLTRRRHSIDFDAMHLCMMPELYAKTEVLKAHETLLHMAPESLAATERTAFLHPELPLPHFLLGLAHEGRDEKERAGACYQAALDLARERPWPGRWQALLRLSGLL